MRDNRAADVPFADNEVEHARWCAGLDQDLRQCVRDGRRRSRGLQDDGVAERQRRRRLPRRNCDREVPWRDEPEHANGLAVGFDVHARPCRIQRLTVAAQRLAGKIF